MSRNEPEPPAAAPRDLCHLVLYDGVCGLCHRAVGFLVRHDRRAALRFAPLQGETARPILQRHQLPADLSTMVLVVGDEHGDERVYTRSTGALEILAALGGGWRLMRGLRLVPRSLRDAVYGWVARRRYGWFGRSDVCELPAPAAADRFLP